MGLKLTKDRRANNFMGNNPWGVQNKCVTSYDLFLIPCKNSSLQND